MYHTCWEKKDLYRILPYNMSISHEELVAQPYINQKSRTARLPSGTVPEEFFQGVYDYVRRTGQALSARPPGKFSEIPQLSLAFVPGNLFAEHGNTYENCRYFVYELQEGETLRDIASVLFELYHHYPDWNFFVRRSNTSEMVFSSEEMYHLLLAILQDPLQSETTLLKEVRNNGPRKRKNR